MLAFGPVVEARAETLVVAAGIDRFCEGKFLPDSQVSGIDEYMRRWAENRRFVVRYTSEGGVVEVTPPMISSERSADDLMRELTTFLGAFLNPCPAGSTQIPVSVSVEGLDFAPDGTILPAR
jgi:hypothetical protein